MSDCNSVFGHICYCHGCRILERKPLKIYGYDSELFLRLYELIESESEMGSDNSCHFITNWIAASVMTLSPQEK